MDISRKDFEVQKRILMDRVTVSVDQLKLTLDTFNRNMETANRLGKQFKPPAEVWAAFHKSVQNKSGIEAGSFVDEEEETNKSTLKEKKTKQKKPFQF
ncbi:hypothetical protein BD560DRAFT_437699 [Blakeslea trispora]|nr:hypothetical protein BD560DRAFT_437699 [Blakeslea trispora]